MDTLLVNLARELRDDIYEYYFLQEDGYEYNHDSGRLRSRDSKPRPNPFAQMYTCKAIYQETRGMALKANVLVFSSYLSQKYRDNVEGKDIRII